MTEEQELEIDNLLVAFQHVCEDVCSSRQMDVSQQNFDRLLKDRAILRNDLRARLLVAAPSTPERDNG